MHPIRTLILSSLLGTLALSAQAEEWKNVTAAQGVKLESQSVGNIGRLRFTNTTTHKATVQWTVETALASKKTIAKNGELQLDAGETVVVSNGPFRDSKGPQLIEAIQGKLSVSPAAK